MAFALEYFPITQVTQFEPEMYIPASQLGVHDEAPGEENFPESQVLHVDATFPE
jgi:hypothetical protein